MLITVSSYSFITTFPRMVAIAWKEIGTVISSDINYFFVWSVNIIAPWNYCGNFFFYVLSGRLFRKELVMLFCCRKRSTGVLNGVYFVNVLKIPDCHKYLRFVLWCHADVLNTVKCKKIAAMKQFMSI